MARINSVTISPPLINSSCAWSSELDQLQALYDSPYTGAVTTRTATLGGFTENESHTVAFTNFGISSINSYGYSPHPLQYYTSSIQEIYNTQSSSRRKPFIISITSSDPAILRQMVQSIQDLRAQINDISNDAVIAIELNTSCPNIPNSPPSGYSFASLLPLLDVLKDEFTKDPSLTIGLKLPPFVYRDQFIGVITGLKCLCFTDASGITRCPISFLTCTNTLGNTLAFTDQVFPDSESSSKVTSDFAVPPALGGSAGDAIHSLSLGNVFTFRQLLSGPDMHVLQDIQIIGVGGVTSNKAAERMRRAGAVVVGSATFFGNKGVDAFRILSWTRNDHDLELNNFVS